MKDCCETDHNCRRGCFFFLLGVHHFPLFGRQQAYFSLLFQLSTFAMDCVLKVGRLYRIAVSVCFLHASLIQAVLTMKQIRALRKGRVAAPWFLFQALIFPSSAWKKNRQAVFLKRQEQWFMGRRIQRARKALTKLPFAVHCSELRNSNHQSPKVSCKSSPHIDK